MAVMTAPGRTPVALTIAGSDSGGGAGIQADLKAFAAAGVHGTSAITALTAQNTTTVTAIEPISPAMIVAQVAAVADDLPIDAVKIGMLGDAGTIRAVAEALALLPDSVPVVHDPVMIAESGARLLAAEAMEAMLTHILPRATVITPNLSEARELVRAAGHDPETLTDDELLAALATLGSTWVMVTGATAMPRSICSPGRTEPAMSSSGRATPMVPRMAPDAPMPPRWQRTLLGARRCRRLLLPRALLRRPPSSKGSASSAGVPGPSMCSGSGSVGRRQARRSIKRQAGRAA